MNSASLELKPCMWTRLYICGCHSFGLFDYYLDEQKSFCFHLFTDECKSFVICRMCFHSKCFLLNTDFSQNCTLRLLLCSFTAHTVLVDNSKHLGSSCWVMCHWCFIWAIFIATYKKIWRLVIIKVHFQGSSHHGTG